MATLKNLMIRLGVVADTDRGTNAVQRSLRRTADQADRVNQRFNLLGGRFDSVGGVAQRLTGHIAGFVGTLVSAGVGLVVAAAKMAVLAAAMASATSAAVSLAAALAPTVGITAALPGAILLGVAAFGTLKLALSGVGDAFKEALTGDIEKFLESLDGLSDNARAAAFEVRALKPAVDVLRASLQDAFFAPLARDIQIAGDLLINSLQPGMVAVAGEFGKATEEVLIFGQSINTIQRLELVFDAARITVGRLGEAIQPLLRGFLALGVVGAQWLAGLSGGIADAAGRFGGFLWTAAKSGRALAWMENALAVFKQLGSILGDVGGIVKSVFTAMRTAGGSVLGVVGQLLDRANAFLKSGEGQAFLVTVFQTLGTVGAALWPVFQALAGAIGGIAPIIAELATLIGPILTGAVTALAPALQALGPGLVAVFTELGRAVGELAQSGALTLIGQALADILIAVAPLLPALADLLVPTLQFLATLVSTYVAPALETLVGWIKQGVAWLTGEGLSEDTWLSRVVIGIRDTVLPIWQQIFDTIGKVFADIVAWVTENKAQFSEWGDRIGVIFKDVGDIVSGVWTFIKMAWDEFGPTWLDAVSTIFDGILTVIEGVVRAIKGVIEVVLGLITGDWERAWNGVKMIFSGVWTAIVGIFETALGALKLQFAPMIKFFTDHWDQMWGAVKRTASDALNWIKGIPGMILGALGNLGSLLVNTGHDLIVGFWNGMVGQFNDLKNRIYNFFSSIMPDWVKQALGIASPSKVFAALGEFIPAGLAMGIDAASGLVSAAALRMAETATISVQPSLSLSGAGGPAPTLTPTFAGVAAPVAGGASRRGGGTVIENLNLAVNGADLNFRNPGQAARQLLVELRAALRDLDREQQ